MMKRWQTSIRFKVTLIIIAVFALVFVGLALALRYVVALMHLELHVLPEDQALFKLILICSYFVILAIGLNSMIRLLVIYVARPLQNLQQAADDVADGYYDRLIVVEREDEIGKLELSFNHMAEAIHFREQKLRRIERILAEQQEDAESSNEDRQDSIDVPHTKKPAET